MAAIKDCRILQQPSTLSLTANILLTLFKEEGHLTLAQARRLVMFFRSF